MVTSKYAIVRQRRADLVRIRGPRVPVSRVQRASAKDTHHPPLLPPNTKSIRVYTLASPGRLNPVNVAKSPEIRMRGVSALRSRSTNSSRVAGTLYFSANVSLMGTGGITPVAIWYAPESYPRAALLKSPVTMTGAEVVCAS